MHIAYVSIWCPVDIVVLNLDFTDLCGFYITCGVGEKRGREGVGLRVVCLLQLVFKAVHWEIHRSTSWHS